MSRSSTARERRVETVALLARRALHGEVAEEEHRRGKERLLMAAAMEAALPRSNRRAALGLAAALVLAAVLALFLAFGRAGALEWRLEGGGVAEGGWLQAEGSEANLRFSEGTIVVLRDGTRARLAAVSAIGARLVLERGAIDVHVSHRPGADWTFDAGPYSVHVTGTEFAVTWSGDRLEVAVVSGSVMVRGPLAADGVAVVAGQTLVAEGGSVHMQAAAPPAPALAASAVASAVPPVPSASPSPSAPAPPGWQKRVASGDFAGVVADAEARGVGAVLGSAGLDDLVALADAARYAGRSDLARQSLAAMRRRFPQSAAGHSAAFLLGRMADEGGGPADAIAWYERYLAEGGGPFAAEALGRKMVAEQRAGRTDAARASAAVYLERYPEGAHARAARGLLGGGP